MALSIELRYRESGLDPETGMPRAWTNKTLTAGETTFTLDDAIYAGRTYTIQARSVDSDHHVMSDWVETVHVVDGSPNITYLQPTSVHLIGVADGIAVSWTVSGRTPPGTTYTVERAPDNAGTPGTFVPITTTRSLTFTDGILDGGLYWYRIKAITFNGGESTYATSTVPAKAKTVADGADVSTDTNPNPVVNPFFEAGDYGWTLGSGWSIVQTINAMSGGWYAVKNSGDAASVLQNDGLTPLVAGQQVTARAYVRSTSATGSIQVGIQWLDANQILISTTYGTPIAPSSAVSWIASEAQANAPLNAVFAKLIVNVSGYSTGQWAVDNCYVYLSQPGLTDEEKTAVQQLADFASDSRLVPAEKDAVIRDYQALINVHPQLVAQANLFNGGGEITSQITAYNTAISQLKAYMTGLGPVGHQLTDPLTDLVIIDWCAQTSDVDGPTLRARFISAYTTENALRDAIELQIQAGQTTVDLSGIQAQLGDLVADNRLTNPEKSALVIDMRMLFDEYGDIILRAGQFATVSTTNYVAAIAALDTYARNPIPTPPAEATGGNGLGVPGTVGVPPTSAQYTSWLSVGDVNGTIRVAPGTLRDRFGTAFLERQRLIDAMHDASRMSAAQALAELASLASDGQLAPGEKGAVVRDYKALIDLEDTLVAQANLFNEGGALTAARDAYILAIANLTTYMTGAGLATLTNGYRLPDPLTDVGIANWCSETSNVDGPTIRATFAAAYLRETELRNTIETVIQAGTAGIDLTSINQQLADLASDSRLTFAEKGAIVVDMRALYDGHADILAKAQGFDPDVDTTAYVAAMGNLDAYCRAPMPVYPAEAVAGVNGLGVPGSITTPITPPTPTQYNSWLVTPSDRNHTINIIGATLRDRFGSAFYEKQRLLNAIDDRVRTDTAANTGNIAGIISGAVATRAAQDAAAVADRLTRKIRYGTQANRLAATNLEDDTLWFETDSTPPYKPYRWRTGQGWTDVIADGSIVTSKLDAGAVTADKMAANAVTAKSMTVTDFTNLCMNPSGDEFNSASPYTAHGWDANPSALCDGNGAFSPALPTGSRAIVQTFQYGYFGPWFEVKPGDEFWIEFDAYTLNTTRQVSVGLAFSTSGPGSPSIWQPIADYSTGSPVNVYAAGSVATLQNLARMVRVPANVKFARIFTLIDATSTFGTAYFRNIFVRRRSGGNLVVDGGITAEKFEADSIRTTNYASGGTPGTASEYATAGAKMRRTAGMQANEPSFLIDPRGMKVGQTLVSEAFFAREDSRYMYIQSMTNPTQWAVQSYEAYKGVGAAPSFRIVNAAGKGNILELHWPQLALYVSRLFGFVNEIWGSNGDHTAYLTYQLKVVMTSVGYTQVINSESRVCLGLAFYHSDPTSGWMFMPADQVPGYYSIGLMAGIRGFAVGGFVL